MRTERQQRWDLRRALAKRGPSEKGWRWAKKPTALELRAFKALR